MKRTISSLLIGLAWIAPSSAEDLKTVYEQAKANDPVVLKAQALYLASEESVDVARSVLLPQINANASAGFSSTESDRLGTVIESEGTTVGWGASLNMQLYHHDSWLNMDIADMQAHQADIAFQAAKQDLILRVTQAYFDVLQSEDDLEFAIAETAAIERQLEQTKQRYSVGLTAITSVHEAQAQYDSSVTEQIRAENELANSKEALRVLTNVYPGPLHKLDIAKFSTTRPTPDSADGWQQYAEDKNLDLIFQKIGVDIAKQNIDATRAGHYPTLDLAATYDSDSTEPDVGNDFYNDQLFVGVQFNLPIYSGGRTSSQTDVAQNQYVASSQDLAQTHRQVVQVARNSYNLVIAAISAIRAFEQSVVSAESALKATQAGFDVGTRTIVDVLDSTRNVYNAKRNLSSTRYGYISAILTLKRAGGMITEQDLLDINKGLIPAELAPPTTN
ncbi:outer membrane channel protein TolC [Thalassotalea agarivorans]|uniref:Outer membrane protein n=1 Tax=Thalassotalea agarivorans TaxID=349064 RepID=A0A1I0HT11_THASX|nr:outer membrane channel protein TolC [Thalassotalea agarivorans]SET87177.1 outer membrane protein [Thalassotalea agarivorans]